MCVSTCMHITCHMLVWYLQSQKGAFQSLELGLHIILKCVLATKPGPSARAASFLRRWAISPTVGLNVNFHAPEIQNRSRNAIPDHFRRVNISWITDFLFWKAGTSSFYRKGKRGPGRQHALAVWVIGTDAAMWDFTLQTFHLGYVSLHHM